MQLFTLIGLIVAISGAICLVTYLIGRLAGDDDYTLQWLFACMAYGFTVALFIMYRSLGG